MEQFIAVFLLAIVCLLLVAVMTAMYSMKHGSQFPCLLTYCCCLHITYVLDWGSSEVMAFSRRQKKIFTSNGINAHYGTHLFAG